jgi:hypothetical protein
MRVKRARVRADVGSYVVGGEEEGAVGAVVGADEKSVVVGSAIGSRVVGVAVGRNAWPCVGIFVGVDDVGTGVGTDVCPDVGTAAADKGVDEVVLEVGVDVLDATGNGAAAVGDGVDLNVGTRVGADAFGFWKSLTEAPVVAVGDDVVGLVGAVEAGTRAGSVDFEKDGGVGLVGPDVGADVVGTGAVGRDVGLGLMDAAMGGDLVGVDDGPDMLCTVNAGTSAGVALVAFLPACSASLQVYCTYAMAKNWFVVGVVVGTEVGTDVVGTLVGADVGAAA